jgi:hypothetical protein
MSTEIKKTEAKYDWHVVEMNVSVHGYSGDLKLRYRRVGPEFTVDTLEYRINKGGHTGGNKANINFKVTGGNGATIITDSPDSMIQDGNWRPYARNVKLNISNATTAIIEVEFIFDRTAGADPRGMAIRHLTI